MANNTNIIALAEHCRVSPSTVSRVFNGKNNVRRETRELILRAAEELNYTPQQTARREIVAIIVPRRQELAPPSWFASMISASLFREISRAGLTPRIVDAEDLSLLQAKFMVAGVLLEWGGDHKIGRTLSRFDFPIIGVNCQAEGLHSACTDHAGAVLTAMRHLLARGHKKIVYVEPPCITWGTSERVRGYRQALAEAGLPYDDRHLSIHNREHLIDPDLLRTLLVERNPTALVCLHEDWALQLYYFLCQFGYRIGEDISLITAEVPGMMQWMPPGITAVRQDTVQLADAVVELIQLLSERPPLPGRLLHQMLPCSLIERGSVHTPA